MVDALCPTTLPIHIESARRDLMFGIYTLEGETERTVLRLGYAKRPSDWRER
jgi:hypothetical protein